MGQPGLFSFIFGRFKQKINFYNKSMWKNAQMSIQYAAPGFEPTTFFTWAVTHNQGSRPNKDLLISMILLSWSQFYRLVG